MPRAFVLMLVAVAAACSARAGDEGRKPPAPQASASSSPFAPLPRSVHPLARPANDVGRLDSAKVLAGASLLLAPTPEQASARDALLVSLESPTSGAYHRWLTPDDYAARFGASAADLTRMTSWLTTQGLTVLGPSRTRTQLFFSGTVAQIEQAFHAEMHRYRVKGEEHFAMATPPSVPEDLAPRVVGVHGVDDFRPHAPDHGARPVPPDFKSSAYGTTIAPVDFATLYDLTPLYTAGIDGTGMSIAVVEGSYYAPSDIAAFRSFFGLSAENISDVLVPNTGNPTLSALPGYLDEAEIDLEWVGAVARNASISFVYTGDADNNDAVLDSLLYAVSERIAPVVSISYGLCELEFSASDIDFLRIYGTAASLEGMTIVAATGDSAAAGCDIDADPSIPWATRGLATTVPASSPWVTAVGGTSFPNASLIAPWWDENGNALAYDVDESAWNDTSTAHGILGGGGGSSTLFAKPSYQLGSITPADGARDIPDVSLSAGLYEAPYIFFGSSSTPDGGVVAAGLEAGGGTSFAAPAFAGVLALVNQSLAKKNPASPVGLGNANPVLYALAQSAPSAFHDVKYGNIYVPCLESSSFCGTSGTIGYPAGAGYDLATGLGSIDANALVTAWTALTPTTTTLAASPSNPAESTAVTLTATVASTATSPAMTGTVSFIFETYTDATESGLDESWVLGSATIAASTAGGVATVTTTIPAGASGQTDIVAAYSGDSVYLASTSAKLRVNVTATPLVASPATITMNPGTFTAFTVTGGVAPIAWRIVRDESCTMAAPDCAQIDATGLFQAGQLDGEVTLHAVDSLGADSELVTVTVSGPYVDAGPFPDSAAPLDSGANAPPSDDSGSPLSEDSGALSDASPSPADAAAPATDAGPASSAPSSPSGCTCTLAAPPNDEGPRVPFASALLALAHVVRRRARAYARNVSAPGRSVAFTGSRPGCSPSTSRSTFDQG